MNREQIDRIAKANPAVDPTALERSRQAVKQLADAGIKLGGYRLMPALGGGVLSSSRRRDELGDSADAGDATLA
ncbi:MAG: hypothetical protein F4110_07455 [Acidimicrobiaceae bacterium]|nr:hypothetical protein [Acidimicrobiaceae bacterium]MXZ97731.1 hypothetical protein [Acidimicrobiaceae bacterium]MYE96844.1 hypothetical protein [Acidimicrobiaceae bacterium]MYH42685.1 hypothetical protein [Acidimicrobiaceae bacterium]MYI53800.1 hypothetical protein [Acidimicrobiaceae bacterium]